MNKKQKIWLFNRIVNKQMKSNNKSDDNQFKVLEKLGMVILNDSMFSFNYYSLTAKGKKELRPQ